MSQADYTDRKVCSEKLYKVSQRVILVMKKTLVSKKHVRIGELNCSWNMRVNKTIISELMLYTMYNLNVYN